MNYLCLVDGLIEYASTSESDFFLYQLMYEEIKYIGITEKNILELADELEAL